MATNPAPLTRLQDLYDTVEEVQGRIDRGKARPGDPFLAACLRRQLRTEFADQALRDQIAYAIERNGITDHTRRLFRGLGYNLVPWPDGGDDGPAAAPMALKAA